MQSKHLDIDETVKALREETGSPEAKVKVRLALRGRSRRVFAWRLVAVAGTCGLLLVPLLLKRESGSSFAATLSQVAKATTEAPISHERTVYAFRGHKTSMERWVTGFKWSHRMEGSKGFIADMRRGEASSFMRFAEPPYEVVSHLEKREKMPQTTLEQVAYSLKAMLKTLTGPNAVGELISEETVTVDGKELKRFKVRPKKGLGVVTADGQRTTTIFDADLERGLIVRSDTITDKGQVVISTVIDYPESVDPAVFEPPPVSDVPRFDADVEQKALRTSMVRVQKISRGGGSVTLLAAIQDPGKRLWVLWKGEPAGSDTSHPVRIPGGVSAAYGHKVRQKAPFITASALPTKNWVSSVTVEVPIYVKGKFSQYAKFKDVPVRRSLPIHFLTSKLK